jgi:PAS domain S-box-containing protein
MQQVSEQTPKELLKQRFRSLNPEFRYYKSLFNSTSDLIAVTDGDKIMDANTSFIHFFSAQSIDVFDPAFKLSSVFVKVDKYGYVYDGYEKRRWFETILQQEKHHYRVAISCAEGLCDFNAVLDSLEPVDDIFVITLTDITEMMWYKSALEESFRSSVQHKEEAQLLLQQYDRAIDVSNLVAKSDLEGTITYVNDAFCQALKYRRDELVGKNVLIFCTPDEEAMCHKSIWKMVKKGKVWKGVLKNIDKERGLHYFDTTVVPIKNQSGKIVEYLSVQHDITEMMNAKKEAIHTLEAKTKFFNQVSHELRTPLNAIINFTDQALENFDEMFEDEISRDLVKMYLQRAYKNSESLLSLINSLLDLAKMKSGKETFAIGEYDAVGLVREAYENCASLNKESKVDYKFKSNIGSVLINCDPLKFRQILTNLISNAFKFTESGFIDVQVNAIESEVRIEVSDSGKGIPSDKLALIFEPFQQGRDTDLGTGLGLSIVSEYAQVMGLSVDVRSTEGQGTCFTLKTKKIANGERTEWTI